MDQEQKGKKEQREQREQNDRHEHHEHHNRLPFDEDNYTHNIHKDNERKLDRRGFMKLMVGAAGIFAVSTMPWGAIAVKELTGLRDKKYKSVKIVDVSAIQVGEAVEFSYPGNHDSALLIRLGENEFKAYQNACTHLKCPVFWSKENSEMICPCHHGVFDPQSGAPTAGPPRRPLPEIVVELDQGAIFATGVKRYET